MALAAVSMSTPLAAFHPDRIQETLRKSKHKASLALAVPRLQQFNDSRPILRCPNEILELLLEHVIEEDMIHTAFSSFSCSHPRSAPLSIWGVSRRLQAVASSGKHWASISGAQHSPNSPHPKLIETWLKRVGETLLLNLHIAPPDSKYDESGIRVDQFEDAMTPAILRLFMKQQKRWQHIAFDLDDDLAKIYLDLLDRSKPREPRKLVHLELLANKLGLGDEDRAKELFQSIELYGESVKKLLWGGVKGMMMNLEEPIKLPHVTVLGLDVFCVEEVVGCLRSLKLPVLEELKLCFTGEAGGPAGVQWKAKKDTLFNAIGKLQRIPTTLFIHDEGFGSWDLWFIWELAEEWLGRRGMPSLAVRADALELRKARTVFEGTGYVVSEGDDDSVLISLLT